MREYLTNDSQLSDGGYCISAAEEGCWGDFITIVLMKY